MSSPSEAVFQILLSLADEPRHGLGIAEEVERRTGRRVRLGASTLYTAIRRMNADQWIQEATAGADEDPRRRFYSLTPAGRRVLEKEAMRLDSLVRDARGKSVIPDEGRA
ncbi:MAG: PadR family transcriptional regulator [Acidobacteria bacterium]|nr:PadR family transcriptional regulator [Acidobacteriota bacterium]